MEPWLKRILAVTALSFVAACGGGDDDPTPGTLVQEAQRDARLTILAEAVDAAELEGTLSGPGPYTLFAPSNEAFSKLLAELGVTKAELLADKRLLTQVLTYHVVPGRAANAQLPRGKAVATVQGDVFKIEPAGSGLVITDGRNRDAAITAVDLSASNGVIHVVDQVLLPADKTVVETAQALPEFGILVEAVVAAGLVDALNAPGPLTVFAPTNAAFESLLAELGLTKAQLLADKDLLANVLTYHVVDGRVFGADVPVATPVATLQGETFSVSPALVITDQRTRAARLVTTDVLASNGVIHAIDRVLLPQP